MIPKRLVRVSIAPARIAEVLDGVDWAKVDATTDADIAAQIAADPDTASVQTDAEHAAGQVKALQRGAKFP